MQVLQAGRHKLILLEIDSATIHAVAQQAGFEARLKESPRSILVELTAESRDTPLLLFDAADPANLGWFSRCQFYVDGRTGGVMQTPITVANKRDRAGRSVSNSLRMRIAKELPGDVSIARQTASDRAGVLHDAEQLPAGAHAHGCGGLRRSGGAAPGGAVRSTGFAKLSNHDLIAVR